MTVSPTLPRALINGGFHIWLTQPERLRVQDFAVQNVSYCKPYNILFLKQNVLKTADDPQIRLWYGFVGEYLRNKILVDAVKSKASCWGNYATIYMTSWSTIFFLVESYRYTTKNALIWLASLLAIYSSIDSGWPKHLRWNFFLENCLKMNIFVEYVMSDIWFY